MANLTRLPMPLQVIWEWQYEGACNGQDAERFFSPAFERGTNRATREAAAKAICHRCPVKQRCLDHALEVQEPFGIWGGQTHQERKALLRAARLQDAGQPHRVG